ncbi:hypothetical protein DW004_03755 [Firmicutes bacterium AF36-3BH]|jgi:hypothetical protein|nr:hypothetical protein DW004_03755 [Firmicutes bacterium AF36-3BH]
MEKFYPTKAGIEYAALTAQGKIIEFTKGKFGDGVRSTENITELTDLIHPLGELPISKKSVKNSTIITTTQFSNRVGGSILPTFYLMEIGLFAKVVNADGTDDDEHPETLIGYAFDGHGDKIIGTSLSEFIINIPLTVADVNNVTVDIDSLVYPTLKQFEDEVNTRKTEDEELQNSLNVHITDTSNPHGVTAEQIGLDKVPNVATNDQTPTYSQNSSLSNITSGEKLSVSFGKIMKAIADLISHIGSKSNPHSVTKSQVGLDKVPNVTTDNQSPTFTEAATRANITSGETLSTLFGKIKKFFTDLKTVAFTGSYTDLSNKPTSMQNPNSLTLTMNGSSSIYNGSATASKSWYAPTSVGTAGYNLISNGSGAPVWQQPPYAVCSTSSGTGAKTVSITNFKLVTGTRVSVKFSNKTSTTPTLNVSSTGAKEIKLVQTNGTYVSVNSYNSWSAGEIVELIYDGTYWVAVSSNMRFVSGAQSATVIVGTTYSSGYCDYRCDGSNDVSIINTAIQDAYSRLYKNDSDYTGVAYPNLGVKVFFKAGVYKVNGNIYTGNTAWVSNNNYITLEGESENAVTFVKTTDNSHSLIDATDISFVFKNINFHFAQVASTEIKCSGVSFYDCNITLRTAGYSGDSFTFIVAHNSDNGVVRMNGGSFTFITVSGWTPCITGIDCYGVDIHNCNIQLKNGANSNNIPSGDSLELNFIYQTQSNATRGTYPNIMSHCTFKCSGNTSIIASTEISITESEITLADKSSKISHYATSSSQTLRNIFANNRVHSTGSYVYMRFGVITCNSFGRADTYGSVSSSYSYYLYNEVCCSITGNFFVGSWSLYLGSRNATVTGNMYKGSLSKSSTSTGTVTMANNVAAN